MTFLISSVDSLLLSHRNQTKQRENVLRPSSSLTFFHHILEEVTSQSEEVEAMNRILDQAVVASVFNPNDELKKNKKRHLVAF